MSSVTVNLNLITWRLVFPSQLVMPLPGSMPQRCVQLVHGVSVIVVNECISKYSNYSNATEKPCFALTPRSPPRAPARQRSLLPRTRGLQTAEAWAREVRAGWTSRSEAGQVESSHAHPSPQSHTRARTQEITFLKTEIVHRHRYI